MNKIKFATAAFNAVKNFASNVTGSAPKLGTIKGGSVSKAGIESAMAKAKFPSSPPLGTINRGSVSKGGIESIGSARNTATGINPYKAAAGVGAVIGAGLGLNQASKPNPPAAPKAFKAPVAPKAQKAPVAPAAPKAKSAPRAASFTPTAKKKTLSVSDGKKKTGYVKSNSSSRTFGSSRSR